MTSDSNAVAAEDTEVSRDESYYFDLVTFKVDNCLFKVPKQKFQELSRVFRDMFALPARNDGLGVEGTSDENPILLEGVSKKTFKLLLSFLYPLSFGGAPTSLSFEECISLLDLSRMWDFEQIRNRAVVRIKEEWWHGIDPIQKVELAHKYEITGWYASAYKELAAREDPLTPDEALRLGVDFTARMAQVREKRLSTYNHHQHTCIYCRRSGFCSNCSSSNDLTATEVATVRAISDIFKV